MVKILVHQYVTILGINPFEKWFNRLEPVAAAKVAAALYKLELGNYSNVKSLGGGVFESKISFGPGYRIYFGQDGDELVILLGGGTKKQQNRDIEISKKYWLEYKLLKKQDKKPCH